MRVVEALGADSFAYGALGGQPVVVRLDSQLKVRAGDRLPITSSADHLHFFDTDSGKRIEGLTCPHPTPRPRPLSPLPARPAVSAPHRPPRRRQAGAGRTRWRLSATVPRSATACSEFDVKLSADGKPVLLHDATLDRTTSGHGRADALTLGGHAGCRRLAQSGLRWRAHPHAGGSGALHPRQRLPRSISRSPVTGAERRTGAAVALDAAACGPAARCRRCCLPRKPRWRPRAKLCADAAAGPADGPPARRLVRTAAPARLRGPRCQPSGAGPAGDRGRPPRASARLAATRSTTPPARRSCSAGGSMP